MDNVNNEILTQKNESKPNRKRPTRGRGKNKRQTAEPQERIAICLSCTKPAKQCKGDCFWREL